MSNQIQEIQENLIDWFEDVDDAMFVGIIKCFVYHEGTSDVEVTDLLKKFLDENELNDAYASYLMEIKNPSKFFVKDPVSIEFIEKMKTAFLSLAFNRFKHYF